MRPEVAAAPAEVADTQAATQAPAGPAPQGQAVPAARPSASGPPSAPASAAPAPAAAAADGDVAPKRDTVPQLRDGAVAPAAEAAAIDGAYESAGGGTGGGGDEAMDVDRQEGDPRVGADAGVGTDADGPSGGDTADEQAFSGVHGVSLKLLRLLAPNPATAAATAATGGGGTAAAGSSGSSGRAASLWVSLPAASRCLLVLDCAMAEAGFESLLDLPALAAQGGALPRHLLYACSYIAATRATAGAGLDHGSAANSRGGEDVPMAEAFGAASSSAAAGAVTASGGDSGSDSARGGAAPVVKLCWYGMGRYLVVHGVPCICVSAAAATSSLSTVTLHIDLSEYGSSVGAAVAAGGGTPWTALSQPSTAPPPSQQPQQVLLLPADPAAHWRWLKDGLVLPLLAAACRAAGAPPPLGLLVLPLELQMAVLRRLEARDLAALSGVCTALHHLASEDELWRPLYDKEFGPPPAADTALANARGFKYVYGRRWRERAERRKRRHVFLPLPPVPVWGPPPLAPFMRPPYMPPGAIGGDYDRLPPPLLPGGGGAIGGPPAILGARRGMFAGGRGGLAGGFPGLGHRPWGGGSGGGGFF